MPVGDSNGIRLVALITGAQQGIGRAAAIALAENGVDVAINWLDDRDAAEEVGAAARSHGRNAHLIRADVTKLDDIEHMVGEVENHLGRIDILVNNAGIFPRHPFLDTTEKLWDDVLATNLKSVAFCSQLAAKAMIGSGNGGAIVNVTSQALRGSPRGAAYSASKAGIVGLTRTMALELASHHIRVNAVAPGLIDTLQPRGGNSDCQLEALVRNIPLQRMGRSDEVADAIVFLASRRASFITGELIHINGGSYMA